ncbi:isoleucine--tRNA ligase [Orientia chuto str. Dubai]|uniref:Isoleucine--tRNA ligase n=1 Tax=Orientia chuto str. Dubai TaxID=1359168 RepID=A0A0F3MP67_9RICK|nr:isoleucine--tRNA ligase [Candidatus Orientia mediorientalis]KJV57242.1 isoleucine--tRNA ligase [Orientia chuto str. Dubai]
MANLHKKYYPEVDASLSLPTIEKEILYYWQKYNIFTKSVDWHVAKLGKKSNEFVFYDGPPFANGLPHYGHLLTGFIKDTYARYQTAKGKRVERRFGWDCHGLPAEMAAEKELGISGRIAVTNFGIDKFNEYCRSSVMKHTNDWQQYVQRQARWVDFDNSYKTMDLSFMESVLWAFKQLYNKGLIYQSMRVIPYSWACETALSNFETKLDNSYRKRNDKAVTVSFILHQKPKSAPSGFQEYRLLAWTTTPWTLPANLAIAVGKEIDYIAVPSQNICYILGKFALKNYVKHLNLTSEKQNAYLSFKGKELEGIYYQPLFNYFANKPNAFKILCGDFVIEEGGTGIVHMAPGFGEDDQILCQQHNIELVCPVDNAGRFTKEISDFFGMQVFEANENIINYLKAQGNWIKTEQYAHNYPHCWRTDTPLIYKAVSSWYVKVSAFKERMWQLNQQINWIPEHVKDGLFGKWIKNARDWAISRNRFWGTPIPIWISSNPDYPRIDVYGSIAELEKDFGIKIDNLHRPFIDQLTRLNPDDPTGQSIMKRVEDVFDCWFESGSMPYAQVHYPFENKEWFECHFPSDFIVEYAAQTRGWFYTLLVLSTALFDRVPFLNCICHGVILDENRQKLSKRLNNYVDPLELFNKYGADALRFAMLSSAVTRGQELLIDNEIVFDSVRLHLKPLWNAYHFFSIYANADNIQGEYITYSENVLDKFILSKLKIAVQEIDQALATFNSSTACSVFSNFIEVMNNWYIRRSRQRFWKNEKDDDKKLAYNVLYTCLSYIVRAAASFLPMLCEEIYLGLCGNKRDGSSSVHLVEFPNVDNIEVNNDLVSIMDQIIIICSSALYIRNTENIRTRQPLQSLSIVHSMANQFQQFDYLIKEEVNVKNVLYYENTSDYINFKLVLNFHLLGKRIPEQIKSVIQANKTGKWCKQSNGTIRLGNVDLLPGEYSLVAEPKISNGAKSIGNDGIIILNLNITNELYLEGIARDLIRLIQQARKAAQFHISDNIYLEINSTGTKIDSAISQCKSIITQQTLSSICTVSIPSYVYSDQIGSDTVTIKIAKAS